MKRSWGIKLLSWFFALGFAFLIVILGAAVAPPRYTAQNSFTIDWGLLPMSLQLHKSKEEIAKIRSETIGIITRPDMNRVASQICALHGIPNSSAPLLANKLSRFLKVKMAGSKDTQDFFTVEFRNNNASAASLVCQDVARRQKDIINFDILGKDVSDVIKSFQENQELAQKQTDLKGAIYELRQEQEQQFSYERQQQIRECQSELNALGDVEVKADVDQFSMFLDLFAPNPVQINNNVAIKKRGPAYGIFVLTTAAMGGVTAWFLISMLSSMGSGNKNCPPKLVPPPPTSRQ
jgi:hypothetical protein